MSSSFNIQLAKRCLDLSARAYTEHTIVDAGTSTEVLLEGYEYVDPPESMVVIAFRGSREPRDYIMDAKFLAKQNWPGEDAAAVHRGFWTGYKAVANPIVKAVGKAARIVLTGHSLGGARAMLCAAHLVEMRLPVSDVITFGAPRVGNAAFRDFYNEELHDFTLRFEAQGDPVPWTPLWLLNGYRHVGRCAYLKNDGSVTIDPLLPNLPGLAMEVRRNLPSPTPAQSALFVRKLAEPHFLTNYERLLANVKEVA